MKVGFARVAITPALDTLMGGHVGEKKAKSISDELFFRVMVISNGNKIITLASADLLFLEEKNINNIKKLLTDKVGFSCKDIYISATHTHSGPLTAALFGVDSEGEYLKFVESQAAKAIEEAYYKMDNACIKITSTPFYGYAFCARFIMKDGSIETHPWKTDEDIVRPECRPYEDVNFVYAVNESGRLLGGVVNYANHPQTMRREDPAISADFPGSVERRINEIEPDAVVLFLNGACGDICPVNALDNTRNEVGVKWRDRLGNALAEKVMEAKDLYSETLEAQLEAMTTSVRLEIREVSDERINEAKKFLAKMVSLVNYRLSNWGTEEEHSDFLSLKDYINTDAWRYQEYTDIIELKKMRDQSKYQDVTISVIVIGNTCIVALPFEVFTEVGEEIRKNSPFSNTLIWELANGYYGYLPTKKAFERKGGYETITLRSSRFVESSAETVQNRTINLLNQMCTFIN
jgi:hypothetical protein